MAVIPIAVTDRGMPAMFDAPDMFPKSGSNDPVERQAEAVRPVGRIAKPIKPEQLLVVVSKLVRT